MTTAGKSAIVTGGSRGIGAAIVRRLAADGFAVAVNFAGNVGEAEKVVEQVRAAGGEAITVQADVSSGDVMRRLFDATGQAFGGVDVLVNNAGIMQLGTFADADISS